MTMFRLSTAEVLPYSADSNEQVQQFLQEYAVTNEADQTAFFAKWVRFDTYRKVIFPQ